MIRAFIVSSAALILISCQAEPACKPGLVTDLVRAGRDTRLATLDLTPVAKRHIPVGASVSAAMQSLSESELIPSEVPPRYRSNSTVDREYVATAEAPSCGVIGGDRYVIIIGEKQGIVVNVQATRFGKTMA